MSATRPIHFPEDQANRLEADAKAMGLPVAAYIEFLRNCHARQHDERFKDAARFVLKQFPETLKKLAR